jgi:LAS superfamily LD-carboxypeptidase LdcB
MKEIRRGTAPFRGMENGKWIYGNAVTFWFKVDT